MPAACTAARLGFCGLANKIIKQPLAKEVVTTKQALQHISSSLHRGTLYEVSSSASLDGVKYIHFAQQRIHLRTDFPSVHHLNGQIGFTKYLPGEV